MTDYIVPILLLLSCAIALRKKADPYNLMLDGAADGLRLVVTIAPTLVLLLTAVSMLRASGAVDLMSKFFAPVFSFTMDLESGSFQLPLLQSYTRSAQRKQDCR